MRSIGVLGFKRAAGAKHSTKLKMRKYKKRRTKPVTIVRSRKAKRTYRRKWKMRHTPLISGRVKYDRKQVTQIQELKIRPKFQGSTESMEQTQVLFSRFRWNMDLDGPRLGGSSVPVGEEKDLYLAPNTTSAFLQTTLQDIKPWMLTKQDYAITGLKIVYLPNRAFFNNNNLLLSAFQYHDVNTTKLYNMTIKDAKTRDTFRIWDPTQRRQWYFSNHALAKQEKAKWQQCQIVTDGTVIPSAQNELPDAGFKLQFNYTKAATGAPSP